MEKKKLIVAGVALAGIGGAYLQWRRERSLSSALSLAAAGVRAIERLRA